MIDTDDDAIEEVIMTVFEAFVKVELTPLTVIEQLFRMVIWVGNVRVSGW